MILPEPHIRSVEFAIQRHQFGGDILFTPTGDIVVCDYEDCNILLCTLEGEIVPTSKEKGVDFEGKPWRMAHDPNEK